MKFYLLVISLVLFSWSLTAQNSEENQSTRPKKVQVPEIITKLNLLEEVKIDEYRLKFKNVVNDGRCPEKVTCVWPGEVEVMVEIFDGTDSKTKTITIPALGFEKEIFTTSEHVVYLKNLAPYPITATTEIQAYQLILKIHPKKS